MFEWINNLGKKGMDTHCNKCNEKTQNRVHNNIAYCIVCSNIKGVVD